MRSPLRSSAFCVRGYHAQRDGLPYDTLRGVIGLTGDGNGSLKEFGIRYEQVDLLPDGTPDYAAIAQRVTPSIKMVYIQRSRGYSLRPSLFVEDIERIAKIAKEKAPNCIVMVDNCYGEFVQRDEPTSHGADLMAGSLIKNPGGGVAPTGGYIAGRRDLVESCSYRLTTPGTGKEIGCTLGNNRELFMGAFHAPHVTGEALKTAAFTAALFSEFGYDVTPKPDEPRADIIQAVLLRREEALIAFCQGVQKGAPVDAFVTPEPWDMPGYDCQVIMAAGAFTLGREHRTLCGRAAARALCRLDAGRVEFPQRAPGRYARGAIHVGAGHSGSIVVKSV